jgi:hypothetical protein
VKAQGDALVVEPGIMEVASVAAAIAYGDVA